MERFIRVATVAALAVSSFLAQSAVAGGQTADLLPINSSPGVNLNLPLPGVTTEGVSVLGPSNATLTATVNPNGLATTVFFEYGANNVLTLRTPKVTIAAGVDPTKVVADLLGLQPGTSYSYRVVAESPAGTSAGQVLTFSTLGESAVPNTVVSLSTGSPVTGTGAKKKSARCTIVGTKRSETLRGTSRKDVICGLGGNDRLVGRGGNDVLLGGPGKDRLNGGGGRDRMLGNAGNDRLSARDHKRDRVNGGRGRDRGVTDKRDRVSSVERLNRR